MTMNKGMVSGKPSVKDSFIGVAVSVIVTMVTTILWSAIASLYIGAYMGDAHKEALEYAERSFFLNSFGLWIGGMLLFGAISFWLKGKKMIQLIAGSVLTVSLCIAGVVVQNLTIMNQNIPPILIMEAKQAALAYGVAFPTLFGCLSISGFGKSIKKSLCMQGVVAAVFMVLSWVIGAIFLIPLAFGLFGQMIGNLIAAILVLVITVLLNRK